MTIMLRTIMKKEHGIIHVELKAVSGKI